MQCTAPPGFVLSKARSFWLLLLRIIRCVALPIIMLLTVRLWFLQIIVIEGPNPSGHCTLSVLLADIESTYKERDQSFCWDVRDEYIRNFLHGELVTGVCVATNFCGLGKLVARVFKWT
eukprot:1138301-Pelagomonas_calceolata.AAC.2